MSSWWIGKDRAAFSDDLKTRDFRPSRGKVTPAYAYVPKVRKPGPVNSNPDLSHTDKVNLRQKFLITKGLCQKGCGGFTKINPKTKKNYLCCTACKEKQAVHDKIRKKKN